MFLQTDFQRFQVLSVRDPRCGAKFNPGNIILVKGFFKMLHTKSIGLSGFKEDFSSFPFYKTQLRSSDPHWKGQF